MCQVFDVIGQSYYPKWHGTLDDLRDNMHDLITRYDKDIIVVEYSAKKEEVNKLVFELPNGRGKGTCQATHHGAAALVRAADGAGERAGATPSRLSGISACQRRAGKKMASH